MEWFWSEMIWTAELIQQLSVSFSELPLMLKVDVFSNFKTPRRLIETWISLSTWLFFTAN